MFVLLNIRFKQNANILINTLLHSATSSEILHRAPSISFMCIQFENGSIRPRGCSWNLSDSCQTRLRSMAGHDFRLTHLANANSPPHTPPLPPLRLHHHCLCSTLLSPYSLFLCCCLRSPLSVALPLNSPLSPSSALSFLFPSLLSLLVFLRSMRGNFHCSFYPGTGFHCGNTAT